MTNVGFHTYFMERTTKAWKDAGLAVVAGGLVSDVSGSATAAATTAVAMLVPTIFATLEAHRERNGDKSPVEAASKNKSEQKRDQRRFESSRFFQSLNALKAQLSFEDFVTELAKGSNMYGRRLSVTYIKIEGLAESRSAEVVSLLRQSVRISDEVTTLNGEEFLVCTPLLASAKNADVIVDRLRRMLLKSGLIDAPTCLSMGRAIYPLDGYIGADLIQSARDNLRRAEPTAAIAELCAA